MVWCVIGLQALGGIVVALVVKYTDSVLKGFAMAISIVVSCLVSHVFFEEVQPSPQFVFGVAIVTAATLMYSINNPLATCFSSLFRNNSRVLCCDMKVMAQHNDERSHIPLTGVLRHAEVGKRLTSVR